MWPSMQQSMRYSGGKKLDCESTRRISMCFTKVRGILPAKINCEDLQGLITLSEAATRENIAFVVKDSAIPPPKRNYREAEEMDILTHLTIYTMKNAMAQYCNNKKRLSPIQFAKMANSLKIPYEMKVRVLKLFLKLRSAESVEDEDEVRPDLSMETGGRRALARTPSESTIVAKHNSPRPIFQGSSSKREKGKDKESDGSPSP